MTAAVSRALKQVTAAAIFAQAGDLGAQKTTLEVHPHAGDTLHVVLENALTISAAPRAGYAAVPPATTRYRLFTREIVERADRRFSAVLTIVDSVAVTTTGPPGTGLFPDLDRSLEGTRVRIHLAADGASTVAQSSPSLDADLRALIGESPSMLPGVPVAAGESWVRDLPLPVDASSVPAGVVRTKFQLDSLTERGNLAWISLSGTIAPLAAGDSSRPAFTSTGTVTGSIVLDRESGWLVGSRTVVDIESVAAMPGGAEPLVVTVRVVQGMRAMSARR
jgi:hypothetical protein